MRYECFSRYQSRRENERKLSSLLFGLGRLWFTSLKKKLKAAATSTMRNRRTFVEKPGTVAKAHTHTIVFCRKVNSKGKSGKRLSRSLCLKISRKSLSNHQRAIDSLILNLKSKKNLSFLSWNETFLVNYKHHVISSFFLFFRLF